MFNHPKQMVPNRFWIPSKTVLISRFKCLFLLFYVFIASIEILILNSISTSSMLDALSSARLQRWKGMDVVISCRYMEKCTIYLLTHSSEYTYVDANNFRCRYTSSTAQGGGGSFKKRKTIGEIGCCESRMSKQKH